MAAIALSALFSFAASAQDLGYLSPRGGSAFVETAGVAYTSVDFSHPAVTDGALNTATVRWEQAPAAGCTNAMKLKVIRPVMNPFGSFFVIAERGPFNMVNGFNTVSLTPPIDVMAGDYLAVVQLRGDPCGGMAVAKGELSSQMFQFYSSDLVSGSFSTGGLLRTGYEFGARASAAASVLTSIVPAVGSTRGGFGSNFKTSMQLTNTTPWPIKGNLVFHPAGRSALDSDPSLSYSLSNFQTLSYEDVVAQMGQSGLGSMDVMSTSSAAPVITVRVYNDGGAAGTSGFIEEVQGPEAALQFGEITFIATPADAVNFRLNIGVRTLAAGPVLFVSAIDKDGFGIGEPIMKTYGPNRFEQTGAPAFFNGLAPPPGGTIRVTLSSGSAFVYGSTTDNRTNDSHIQFSARR